MSTLGPSLRALWWAMRSGMADHGVIYTVRSWFFGWCLRILAQVLFFLVIGNLLGPTQAKYLLIGNTVLLMAVHSLLATASTTWERQNGTLALLVASPSSPSLVLIGRSMFWVPEGLFCALGALLILGPFAGVPLSVAKVAWCAPLLLLIGVSCYALGVFLGSLMLNVVDLRNVVSNAMLTLMMILCGVNLQPGALGPYAQAVADILPLTRGLRAVRAVLDGSASPSQIASWTAGEAVVGAAWLTLAIVTLHYMAARSRRDGRALFAD